MSFQLRFQANRFLTESTNLSFTYRKTQACVLKFWNFAAICAKIVKSIVNRWFLKCRNLLGVWVGDCGIYDVWWLSNTNGYHFARNYGLGVGFSKMRFQISSSSWYSDITVKNHKILSSDFRFTSNFKLKKLILLQIKSFPLQWDMLSRVPQKTPGFFPGRPKSPTKTCLADDGSLCLMKSFHFVQRTK